MMTTGPAIRISVAAKSYRAGLAFSNPLLAVSAVDELSTKSLPLTHSFCSLTADNLVVTALKKAERDAGLVLRVVELECRRTESRVDFLGIPRRFHAANLLEEETPGEQAILRVAPFEISTLRWAER